MLDREVARSRELAGFITAISPCVLPVLPILLAGSAADDDRRRPFAIIAGLVVSFTVFTLAGAALLSAFGLPEDLLRDIAIAAMLVLAASLLSQRIAWLLERPFLFLTRRRLATEGSGFVLGVSLGLVFVPCAGPVLAAMTALSASGEIGFRIVLVTGLYALGAATPMLFIAIGGQRLTSGVRVLRTHAAATEESPALSSALPRSPSRSVSINGSPRQSPATPRRFKRRSSAAPQHAESSAI